MTTEQREKLITSLVEMLGAFALAMTANERAAFFEWLEAFAADQFERARCDLRACSFFLAENQKSE